MSINTMKLALEALENASPAAWASRVDSDTMKSIWRKHLEALEGLQKLLAELDNASCKSVQKRPEAQQPATTEPVAWLDEMLADTREVFDAGGSETPQVVRDVIEYVKSWVTVYSEKNHQAPAAQPAPSEPATGEPVWCVATGERVNGEETYTHHDAYVPLADCFPLYTHQAPSVPKDDQIAALVNKVRDIARMFHDHQSLRERIAIELVPALKVSQEVKSNAERWRYAIADGENQSMNLLDIFNGWDGDGDFVEAFDAAMLTAKKPPA